jgi:ATP-binding cassette, subfamily B, bacterial
MKKRGILNREKQDRKLSDIKDSIQITFRLFRLIWKLEPWLLTGALVSILIPAVVPFINIYIYKLMIDAVVSSVSGASFNYPHFYTLIGFRVLTYFLQESAFSTQRLMERLLWTKVPIELNQIVFAKISSLDIYYFENDEFRNLLEKVRESLTFRPQRVIDNLLFSLQSTLQVSIAFVALIKLNSIFLFLILLVSVPEFITQAYRSKIAWGIWDSESKLRKRFSYLSQMLQHHQSIKEIKLFSLAGKFIEESKKLQYTFYNNNKSIIKKAFYADTVFNSLAAFVFIGIEFYIILEALAKRLTVGDINFYTGVVMNFQNGLGGLLRNINEVFDSSLYVKPIFEVLDAEPVIKIRPNAKKLSLQKPPVIEFKNVDFAYPGTETKILNDFSIRIEPGEKIAFVGENGAGKSTIIKLLARFYDVNKGEISINGTNIQDLDLKSWYEYIGILMQDFNKYEDIVKDNIYYGNVGQPLAEGAIINAAAQAGAHSMVEKFEMGYEQMLGRMFEGGLELSGGQWQKVALARAFFRNAPVLVLDEPTASIDAKAESEIFNKVEKLSKDKTVIIISHRFSTVRNADKIYVVDNGKIVENGTHQELMKLNGQYATLFNLQAKGYQ